MYDTKHLTTRATLKEGGPDDGALTAIFATLNHEDLDGDIILRSAFTDGQPVAMTWSHQWDKIIGRGHVRTTPQHAIFDGRLFTETSAGREARDTLKALGPLAEYSWGFKVLDAERRDDGVRILKACTLYEVSPVLKGAAGEGFTGTLAIKHRRPGRRPLGPALERVALAYLAGEMRRFDRNQLHLRALENDRELARLRRLAR